MKQFIIFAIFAMAMVAASPDPNCTPDKVPKNVSFSDCCPMKVEMVPKATFDACVAKFPKSDKPPPPGPPQEMVCAIKCALEEVKVYVNDKIDKETAVKLLASKDDKLKADVEAAVSSCLEKAEKIPPPPPGACSLVPMVMTGCVYGELYKKCESQLPSDKPQCKDLMAFAHKCNWVPPCNKSS